MDVLQSYWFIKSDHLGKVSVGQQSSAGDNAAILVDGSGSLVPSNWVLFDNANFFIRAKDGALTGATGATLGRCFLSGQHIGGDCEAIPTNVVRYDSPTFAGFSMSADWGRNGGYWDAYGRYSGEYNGIKIAATSGWVTGQHGHGLYRPSRLTNPRRTVASSMGSAELGVGNTPGTGCDVGYWQSGIYIEHVATGLFVYGAYGREFLDTFAGFNDQPDHWMVKAGLRERWPPLGHTVLYGSYQSVTTCSTRVSWHIPALGFTPTSTRLDEWSLGVVQEIDAAAMSLWVQYDNFHASASGCGTVGGFNGAGVAGSCNGPTGNLARQHADREVRRPDQLLILPSDYLSRKLQPPWAGAVFSCLR